jgi:beta-lactam-binding protein with PASTA domain/tRNA A-37 threonylcarbamoyl transferase component Bud32
MSEPGPTVFSGRYELHRRIGKGGMAEVSLARDQLLDRPVAIKVLFPEFATDPAFVERFRREATAAANLSHPNIVGVYDWGEAEGTYFIVMEYVNGRTLSQVLRADGPLHPDRAADIGADVAAALGFAHRNGVVHRDVKPGNVLVDQHGLVKVADFGIARAITATSDEHLTQVGTVMGTATYFSPEQARGDPVDPRSDLYSLGCVLYELVTGRPPFSGDSPVAIAYKQVHESPVPPRQVNPSVPPALEAIILKCLAKNPANRYPSAEDLRADLRRFREGSRILAEPVMPPPPRRGEPAATTAMAATRAQGATRVQRAPVDYAEEDYYDEPPRRSSGAFFAVLIVLLVLLAGMLFFLARTLGVGDDSGSATLVPVPDVRNELASDAEATLKGLGFEVTQTEEANDDTDAGHVFAQDPANGTKAEKGSTVKLRVSAGAEQVPVPGVVGQKVDEARATLQGNGFTVRVETTTDGDVDPDTVTAQDPPPQTEAAKGSEVVITVKSEPDSVEVPNVRDMTESAAIAALEAKGFTTTTDQEASDQIRSGHVIRTEPASGSSQAKGSQVTVVVSTGQATTTTAKTVTVPNVIGMNEDSATSALQSRGLDVDVNEQSTLDETRDGEVVDQSPKGNTSARSGDTVTITVLRTPGD